MNSIHHGWSLDEIAPEARRAAERAAEAAGMPLEIWLNQLIKYVSAMELSGKGPARARAIDETIKRAAAEQARMGPVDGPAESGPDAPFMLDAAPSEYPTTLPAEVLQPNRFAEEQPGERDVEQAIGEWRKSGALAPLVVRPDTRRPGHYEIVNGMERWHAASRLHMRRIPVTVRELTDEEVLRATLIQKLATKSLPPLDEAVIYQRLMEETGLSVAALSDVIGRSPTHVATALQLLDLPQPVREMINNGELSVLHARTLLGAADPEPAAREVVNRRLDIYQTEQLVRASHGALTPPPPQVKPDASEAIAEPPPTDTAAGPGQAPLTAAVLDLPPKSATPDAPIPETGADAPLADTGADAPPTETAAETAPIETAAEAPLAESTQDALFAASLGNAADLTRPEPMFADTGLGGEPLEPTGPTEPTEPTEIASDTADATAIDEPGAEDVHPESGEFAAAEADVAPDAPEAAPPMLLGAEDGVGTGTFASTSGDGDADALIEATPAIDCPASDVLTTDNHEADNRESEEVVLGDTAAPFIAAAKNLYTEASADENPPPAEPDAIAADAIATDAIAGDAVPADAIGNTMAAEAIDEPGSVGGGNGRDGTPDVAEPADTAVDDSTRMVETHLSTLLGLKVSIAERNQDDGVLSIHYNSENELTDLVSRLNRMPTGRRAE